MKVSSFTIIITKKVIKICINVKSLAIGEMFNYFPSTGLVYSYLREKILKVMEKQIVPYLLLRVGDKPKRQYLRSYSKMWETIRNYKLKGL